jgi:hypothetical protein
VAGAFLRVGDVDGGLEFGADRDPAGGQVQDEAEQEARVEVRGQVTGFLGLGDRVDLGASVRDAGRARLTVGAFQTLPGAQAHDLGPAFVQAYQAGGVAGKVVGVEGHLGFHLQDRLLAYRLEQLGLAAEVVIDLRLVGVGRFPDPLNARSGDPVPGELGVGRLEQATAGGLGVIGSHAAQHIS